MPIPIRRQAEGEAAADNPLCAYDLLLAAWREDVRVLGREAALQSPIFRHSAKGGLGEAYSTLDVARIVRDVAVAAGEDPADFGAHSLRVGGASDFRDLFDCSTAGLEHGGSGARLEKARSLALGHRFYLHSCIPCDRTRGLRSPCACGWG